MGVRLVANGVAIVERMMPQVSNWGRWGADDDLGTLNYATEARRQAALRIPALGRTVACGRSLTPRVTYPADAPLFHHMLTAGAEAPEHGAYILADWFGFQPHGASITHLDALNHMSWNGRLYNGVPAAVVTAARGGAFGSSERVSRGVVTRGVLLDVPRALGVDWIEPGSPITPSQLEACQQAASVEVTPGDAVIVRTGRDRRLRAGGATSSGTDLAGLDVDCLPWLHERQVAMLACEGVHDILPARYDDIATPVHVLALVGMGLWLIDNVSADELARACVGERSWQFLFVLSPISLKNSTGVPVNPLAIF
jgi:kynurenine formamidase